MNCSECGSPEVVTGYFGWKCKPCFDEIQQQEQQQRQEQLQEQWQQQWQEFDDQYAEDADYQDDEDAIDQIG